MKTKKVFTAAALALGLFALSATTHNKQLTTDEVVQCGVSNDEIAAHLQGAPHYHTVYWVQDIPGTCNSKAGIENCQTATVYVSDGRITGHVHSSGGCPQ